MVTARADRKGASPVAFFYASFSGMKGKTNVSKGSLPMRHGFLWAAIVTGMILSTFPAVAQTSAQWQFCTGNPDVNWDKQIATCSSLIQDGKETTKDTAGAYNNRGNAYTALRDYDRAIADFNKAIELDPKNFGAFNNRGTAFRAKNDNDRALADYSAAIKLAPTFAVAYKNRGVVNFAKGDNDRAIADYSEAIRLDPRYVVAYNNRAWSYHVKGDDVKGLADADKAVALAPKDANSIETRAEIYEKLGQRDKAVADYRASLKLVPSMQEAKDGLKRLGATP